MRETDNGGMAKDLVVLTSTLILKMTLVLHSLRAYDTLERERERAEVMEKD